MKRSAAPLRPRAGQLFGAVTVGEAWDERRLRLFNAAIKTLQQMTRLGVPEWLPEIGPPGKLPLTESYCFGRNSLVTVVRDGAPAEIERKGLRLAGRVLNRHQIWAFRSCPFHDVKPIGVPSALGVFELSA